MSKKIDLKEHINKNKKIHVCTICDKEFYWNENSRWYGILENDKGYVEVIEKTCSIECRNNSVYKNCEEIK